MSEPTGGEGGGGEKNLGRRGYFQRLCPAAPRKYSGAKYVNERNTSCKSEGTSKAKASYLQLDIAPVEQKRSAREWEVPRERESERERKREGRKGRLDGCRRRGSREALAQLLIRLGGSPRLKTSGRGFELRFPWLKKNRSAASATRKVLSRTGNTNWSKADGNDRGLLGQPGHPADV